MLQKVYFLSFGSIFLRKRFLLSYFFCKFVARIYQAEASKRKKDLNTSSIPDSLYITFFYYLCIEIQHQGVE
jgi:hypothetical protein